MSHLPGVVVGRGRVPVDVLEVGVHEHAQGLPVGEAAALGGRGGLPLPLVGGDAAAALELLYLLSELLLAGDVALEGRLQGGDGVGQRLLVGLNRGEDLKKKIRKTNRTSNRAISNINYMNKKP